MINSNEDYLVNREFADFYLPQMDEIIEKNLPHKISFRRATVKEDQTLGFDTVVIYNELTIAYRVRNVTFRDFALRYGKFSGHETEVDKMRNGCGDWYLYCWVVNYKISSWMLVDLNKLRQTDLLYKNLSIQHNHKEKSTMLIIDTGDLKANDCIKAYENLIIPPPKIKYLNLMDI